MRICFYLAILGQLIFGPHSTSRAYGETKPRALLIVFPGTDSARIDALSRRYSSVEWVRLALEEPERSSAGGIREKRVAEQQQAYFEADFEKCRQITQSAELRVESLVEEGRRDLARQSLVIGAACLQALRQNEEAASRLRLLLSMGLDDEASWEGTRPELKRLLERERALLARGPKPVLHLELPFPPDQITVDGKRQHCQERQCSLVLPPGAHFVVIHSLSQVSWQRWLNLEKDTDLRVSFAPASSELLRSQLEKLDLSVYALSTRALGNIAKTFEVSEITIVWRNESQLWGLYYRGEGKALVRKTSTYMREGAESMLFAQLRDDMASRQRKKRLRPLLWAGIATAAALAAGLTTYFVVRGDDNRHDLIFP